MIETLVLPAPAPCGLVLAKISEARDSTRLDSPLIISEAVGDWVCVWVLYGCCMGACGGSCGVGEG
jgi:hypothetical protein